MKAPHPDTCKLPPAERDLEDLSDEEMAELLPANPEHWMGVSRYAVPPDPVAYEQRMFLCWCIRVHFMLLVLACLVIELVRSLW